MKIVSCARARDAIYCTGRGLEQWRQTIRTQRSGENVNFERIRRITGYLVGTTDRWNDAKKAELDDRVKHTAKN